MNLLAVGAGRSRIESVLDRAPFPFPPPPSTLPLPVALPASPHSIPVDPRPACLRAFYAPFLPCELRPRCPAFRLTRVSQQVFRGTFRQVTPAYPGLNHPSLLCSAFE